MAEQAARAQSGSVTAEFATALPAVMVVLFGCVTGVHLATTQVRLGEASSVVARSVARGESRADASLRANTAMPGIAVTFSSPNGLLCARLTRGPSTPVESFLGITLTAQNCVLQNGE